MSVPSFIAGNKRLAGKKPPVKGKQETTNRNQKERGQLNQSMKMQESRSVRISQIQPINEQEKLNFFINSQLNFEEDENFDLGNDEYVD